MAKIPHADEGLVCPFHKKDMSLVCHKCPLWVQIRGTDPNTGQPVDDWRCSFTWLPIMLVQNAQQTLHAGAAVESLRNELVAGIERSQQLRLIDASNHNQGG